MTWISFYFSGNDAWGYIDSPEDWQRILEAYKDSYMNLLHARQNPNRTDPSFGFYHEHTGKDTLYEFAKRHNMDITMKLKEIADGMV